MFYIVGGSTGEIFNIGTFAVEIGEDDDLFLIVLAHIFGDDHVVVRVGVVEFDYVVVPTEVVGDLPLQGGAGESSPENLFSLDHGLVRFGYASVEVKEATLLGVGLELPGKFLLVVLLELLLNNANNS